MKNLEEFVNRTGCSPEAAADWIKLAKENRRAAKSLRKRKLKEQVKAQHEAYKQMLTSAVK